MNFGCRDPGILSRFTLTALETDMDILPPPRTVNASWALKGEGGVSYQGEAIAMLDPRGRRDVMGIYKGFSIKPGPSALLGSLEHAHRA